MNDTRLLQESLRLEQIKLEKETIPSVIALRRSNIVAFATELLRLWREESELLAVDHMSTM